MDKDECFIKPSFVRNNSKRSNNRFKKAPLREENEDISRGAQEEPESTARAERGGLMDMIKEHKILIITFAIVIILLICVIVWMTTRGEDKKNGKASDPNNPNPNPAGKARVPPPTNTPPVEQNTTQNPAPRNEPPAARPENNRRVDATPTPPRQPRSTPAPPPIVSHEEIINTVDDSELNKYMNVGDGEEAATQESEKKESKNDNHSTDLDEFAELDNCDLDADE